MAGRWDAFQGLPHGWEVKFDANSGRYYFIDHIKKQTSWEDPRLKTAPPPPPHPDTLPAELRVQQETQLLPHHQNVSNTGVTLRGSDTDTSKHGRSTDDAAPHKHHQEAGGSTDTVEHSQQLAAIAKIAAMFPTVSEAHINDLMKKYHNREAVVISALQVQKHPLATPGPYGTFTPPPMRHFIPTATALMALQSTKASLTVTSAIVATTHSLTTTTAASQDKPVIVAPKTAVSTGSTTVTTTATSNGIAHATTNIDQSTFTSKTERAQYRPAYERARGALLFDDKCRKSPMIGQRGSLERSIGSPRMGRESVDRSMGSPRLGQGSLERSIASPFLGRESPLHSSRASSPHTLGSPRPTTRSTSEFTRSQLGSPRIDHRHSPRPSPHSPKIKLRYLKGIFPKVEPAVILDVLTQCNYSVKDACEKMILLGHEKKETVLSPPRLKERAEGKENKLAPPKPSPAPPRPKNLGEKHKKKVRNQLAAEYPALTPTVVTMALQSVHYDETRARQVLNNMAESDRKTQQALATITPKMSRSAESKTVALSLIGSPPLSRRDGVKPTRPPLPRTRINTAWTAAQTVSGGSSVDQEDLGFRSEQRAQPSGPNTTLHKGPSECLLLSDYQAWHGPNPENASGHSKNLAQGPKRTLLRGPSGLARGQDPAIRKGPQGLAKGSKFTQGIKKEPCFSTKML
ncbi:uncharacterized protein [Cherax quadricarinatus]|uniref:uncharacterized protein isoform X2 n=1 Tax=Cherax quadricarinatus TaxID=27406 RepID=UPI00387E5920